MATTAAAYGCCSAAFPGSVSTRGAPPPPARVSLVDSFKLRATAPGLRVSCHRRRQTISACSSSEVSSNATALPREATVDIKLPRRSLLVQFTCNKCGERTKRCDGTFFYLLLQEATVDIKLPRRSLLVQFTCNKCGERTKRLINRVAYERGTVFLQCSGCQVYHKFVDNLGLVFEYDLREENGIQEENVADINSED